MFLNDWVEINSSPSFLVVLSLIKLSQTSKEIKFLQCLLRFSKSSYNPSFKVFWYTNSYSSKGTCYKLFAMLIIPGSVILFLAIESVLRLGVPFKPNAIFYTPIAPRPQL